MGWQDYSRTSPRHPMSVEYLRGPSGYTWAEMNPGNGVFDFSRLESDLAAARSRGNQLSFRIYTIRGEGFGGHYVPRWALDAGARITPAGDPDYSNAVYQQQWGRFVDELARRYDGHPDIAFIDISGYGNFNEWSWVDQTAWDDDHLKPTSLDGQARKHLADMFIGGTGTVTARQGSGQTTLTYDHKGFHKTQLLMPYAGIRQSTWYVMHRRPDVGFRYDCLGRASTADIERIGNGITELWRRAPVVFEFCAYGGDMDRAMDLATSMHATIVRDNAVTDPRLSAILARIGYRYHVTHADVPNQARPGTTISVPMQWANAGVGRAYRTMGQDFTVELALLRDGRPVHTRTTDIDPMGWIAGSPADITANLDIPSSIGAGSYQFAVSIRDRRTNRQINLAMANPINGWYPISTLTIDGAVAAPTTTTTQPAPAPAPTTTTTRPAPTTSTTQPAPTTTTTQPSAAPAPPAARSENLVANGSFEARDSRWWSWRGNFQFAGAGRRLRRFERRGRVRLLQPVLHPRAAATGRDLHRTQDCIPSHSPGPSRIGRFEGRHGLPAHS